LARVVNVNNFVKFERVDFTDSVSKKGTAIGRVRQSVSLFSFDLLNQMTLDFDFCMCMKLNRSSSGIKSQGHGSRSNLGLRLGSTMWNNR